MQTFDQRARPLQLKSAALGIVKGFFIYLPPEYHDTQRRFPTLYLMRGHEREWINPREDDTRGGTTVIDVYERLRAVGAIGPLILVMPGLASDDNAIPAMLTDFRAPELATGAIGIGRGQFARYFFDELIPYIDRTYRTVPATRAVAGFSLGGYMAIKAAAMRPDLFVSAGAFDGSFPYASDGGREARAGDAIFALPMFDPALGLPRDREHLAAQNLPTLLLRADLASIRKIRWIIQYGPEHLEPWGSNFYRGEYLLRVLRSLGIENAAPVAALADGQHTWRTADRYLEQTLPIHWHALEQAG